MKNEVRSYNIGVSDYAKHEIQPWDIWLYYDLNPWDADIVKRLLRKNEVYGRRMDYEKIIHISKERIRQLKERLYKRDEGVRRSAAWESKAAVMLIEIFEEYGLGICDRRILIAVLTPSARKSRIASYKLIIEQCYRALAEERLKEIDNTENHD